MENTKNKGILSNMVCFKTLAITSFISILFMTQSANANESNNLEKWANDDDYINGILYIEGDRGAEVLKKEISNCPYEKCKLENVDKMQFGKKTIEIKKPDYKKAIELLDKSSENGNALASEKLLNFLIKRIDYKSKNPNPYLARQLEFETGLTLDKYKEIVNKTIKNGIKTNKSCLSEYLAGEFKEQGILGNEKNTNEAIKHYKKAEEVCPTNNINYHMVKSKINTLH